MEATIQQQRDNTIFTIIAMIVTVFLLFAGLAAWHDAGYCITVSETTTMQWTSDTSWVKGGWR